jgi:hypothetical protein
MRPLRFQAFCVCATLLLLCAFHLSPAAAQGPESLDEIKSSLSSGGTRFSDKPFIRFLKTPRELVVQEGYYRALRPYPSGGTLNDTAFFGEAKPKDRFLLVAIRIGIRGENCLSKQDGLSDRKALLLTESFGSSASVIKDCPKDSEGLFKNQDLEKFYGVQDQEGELFWVAGDGKYPAFEDMFGSAFEELKISQTETKTEDEGSETNSSGAQQSDASLDGSKEALKERLRSESESVQFRSAYKRLLNLAESDNNSKSPAKRSKPSELKKEKNWIEKDWAQGRLRAFYPPVYIKMTEARKQRHYPFKGENNQQDGHWGKTEERIYPVVAVRMSKNREENPYYIGILNDRNEIRWVANGERYGKHFDILRNIDQSLEVGAPVMIPSSMSCRSSDNWYGQENIESLVPSGTKGEVVEVKKTQGRTIGYRVALDRESYSSRFNLPKKCWIHAPGVAFRFDRTRKRQESGKDHENCPSPSPLARQDKDQIEDLNIALRSYVDPNDWRCEKPYSECNDKALSLCDPRRFKFDFEIVKAANETGLAPYLIKAQIHAESSFIYRENKSEARVYKSRLRQGTHTSYYLKKYKWGRGFSMLGANNAHLHGVAWYQSRDEIRKLNPNTFRGLSNAKMDKLRFEKGLCVRFCLPGDKAKLKNGEVRVLENIFDDSASIKAKARMLQQIHRRALDVNLKDKKGVFQRFDARTLLSDLENERATIAAYNRGFSRVRHSIKAWAVWNQEQNESNTVSFPFPQTYSDYAYATPLPKTLALKAKTHRRSTLRAHSVGHCHVYRVIGICGEAGGFVGAYKDDFTLVNGRWRSQAKKRKKEANCG